MVSTLEGIKDYIFNEYGLSFEIEHYPENISQRWLKYKIGKREYTLSLGYARQPQIDMENEYWCIFQDYMGIKKYTGLAIEGNETRNFIFEMPEE